MNPVATEWIKKAEGDFKVSSKLAKDADEDCFDAICSYAQQCAEKYLKAFLVSRKIRFDRTHDLEELLKMILPRNPEFEFVKEELEFLNRFSVKIRYPGDFASKEETTRSIKAMKIVRKFVREKVKK
jgi:HEPN domain-containing protein